MSDYDKVFGPTPNVKKEKKAFQYVPGFLKKRMQHRFKEVAMTRR